MHGRVDKFDGLNSPILVFAGTYREVENYRHKLGLSKSKVRWVITPSVLQGIQYPEPPNVITVAVLNTFWDNPTFAKPLYEAARSRRMVFIDDWVPEWLKH